MAKPRCPCDEAIYGTVELHGRRKTRHTLVLCSIGGHERDASLGLSQMLLPVSPTGKDAQNKHLFSLGPVKDDVALVFVPTHALAEVLYAASHHWVVRKKKQGSLHRVFVSDRLLPAELTGGVDVDGRQVSLSAARERVASHSVTGFGQPGAWPLRRSRPCSGH